MRPPHDIGTKKILYLYLNSVFSTAAIVWIAIIKQANSGYRKMCKQFEIVSLRFLEDLHYRE